MNALTHDAQDNTITLEDGRCLTMDAWEHEVSAAVEEYQITLANYEALDSQAAKARSDAYWCAPEAQPGVTPAEYFRKQGEHLRARNLAESLAAQRDDALIATTFKAQKLAGLLPNGVALTLGHQTVRVLKMSSGVVRVFITPAPRAAWR